MDYSIAVIVSNIKIAATAKQVMHEKGYTYPVYHRHTMFALDLADKLVEKGTRLVISIGVTAKYIKKILS